MPYLHVRGGDYFYDLAGHRPGHPDHPTIVFGHGYLMTHRLWDAQVAALADRYRCLRFDWRGQGQSTVTRGGYDPWDLARDALALTEALGIRRFHYVAHSMGGYVGYRMALLAPERLTSMVLIGTSPSSTPPAQLREYTQLLWAVRLLGYGPVFPKVLPILYGSAFLNDPARAAERAAQAQAIRSNDRTGIFRAGRGIFARDDVSARLGEITVPTRLLVGDADAPHPPADSQGPAAAMPYADAIVLPNTGHTPPAERPTETTAHIAAFIDAQGE